jgi:hypothetical protein
MRLRTWLAQISNFLLLMQITSFAGEENSKAYGSALPDGTHVLLRKGDSFGGFELIDQITDPESCAYNWWFRSDGKSDFDEQVTRGTSQANKANGMKIAFGPFDLEWSMSGKGSGWIYYGKMPAAEVGHGDQRLSVTELKSFEEVDAGDRKWIYGAKPFHFDEPIPDEKNLKLKSASDGEIANLARELTNENLGDRTPIWQLVAKLDSRSRARLAKQLRDSKIPELIRFAENPDTVLARQPAELSIPPGPLEIVVRAGICYLRDHPVTDERVIELLKKNRIKKDVPITITPAQFVRRPVSDDSHPRGSGRRIADLLAEQGYTNVAREPL